MCSNIEKINKEINPTDLDKAARLVMAQGTDVVHASFAHAGQNYSDDEANSTLKRTLVVTRNRIGVPERTAPLPGPSKGA